MKEKEKIIWQLCLLHRKNNFGCYFPFSLAFQPIIGEKGKNLD
jgi:hypothetical protein